MDKNDRDLFLEALEQLPKDVLHAKFDGGPECPKPKRDHPKSVHDMVIDFHGSTRIQALTRLRAVLEHAKGKKYHILVITGRGNNSEEGYSVLREAVARFLDTAGAPYIREYAYASPEFGGDGAFEILTK